MIRYSHAVSQRVSEALFQFPGQLASIDSPGCLRAGCSLEAVAHWIGENELQPLGYYCFVGVTNACTDVLFHEY